MEILTVDEVAVWLKISKRHVYEFVLAQREMEKGRSPLV